MISRADARATQLRKGFAVIAIGGRFTKLPNYPLLQRRMAVRITKRLFTKRWRGVITALVCALLAATQLPLFTHSEAQATRPTLISEETSTRAIAVESITRKREPFSPTTEVSWGNDNRTRIMLFAMGIDPSISIAEVTVVSRRWITSVLLASS